MYNIGRGVPEDEAESARWYRKAAEQGDVAAQFKLGGMYLYGHGVPQDYVRAHKWLNLSRAGGYSRAQEDLETIETHASKDQIAVAQKLAREWHDQHRQREDEGSR